MRKRRLFAVLLCICVMLCSCEKPGSGLPKETVKIQTQVPQENRAQDSITLSSQSDGYYSIANGCLFYLDFPTRKMLSLCPQTGCKHNDESCQAWVGSVLNSDGYKEGGTVEYHGDIYAVVIPRNGCVEFVKYEISTGKRTVLASWDSHDNVTYRLEMGRFSEGYCVLVLYEQTVTFTPEGVPEFKEDGTAIMVELATGKQEPCPEGVAMFTENYGFSCYAYPDEALGLLSYEQFTAQHPEIAEDEIYKAYREYVKKNESVELRLHDRSTGTYTVIAETQRDGYVKFSDRFFMKGYHVLFVCKDEVRLLDVRTGQVRVVLEMPNVINYWLCDGKAFLITRDEEGVKVWYASLDDGIAHQLGNQGRTDKMVFGMYDETPNYFVGFYQMGVYALSKEDFYADRYENMFQIG